MRTRVLLAGLGLSVFLVIGTAAPSFAAGGPVTVKSKDKLTQECIDLLNKGKTLDACHQAPSPIIPPISELVWGAISFTIVFVLLRKMAWPGIKKGMDARTERISNDLQAAETQRTEADTILADYKAQLADAKNESGRIIEEARNTADALKREQEQKLQTELAAMKTKATSDIEAAKVQAIADLRSEVADLAIGAAERVVGHSLDRETSTQLVESFIAQVGASS